VTNEEYSETLRTASNALSLITKDVRIRGDGAGRFLVATVEDVGLEFYAAEDRFVVDPAIHEELQGERMFQTIDEALGCASNWLTQER
jgi:hypothetical protein